MDRENALLLWLADQEGVRLTPYLDPDGKQWNVGFGHLLTKGEKPTGVKWTMDDAWNQLRRDWRYARKYAESKVGNSVDDRVKDQLGLLVFNAGPGILNSKRFKAALQSGQPEDVMRWAQSVNTVNGVPDPILTKRRDAEAAFARGIGLPIRKSTAKRFGSLAGMELPVSGDDGISVAQATDEDYEGAAPKKIFGIDIDIQNLDPGESVERFLSSIKKSFGSGDESKPVAEVDDRKQQESQGLDARFNVTPAKGTVMRADKPIEPIPQIPDTRYRDTDYEATEGDEEHKATMMEVNKLIKELGDKRRVSEEESQRRRSQIFGR